MDPEPTELDVLPWDTSVGNRFAHYSPDDHSATLWIAAALACTYIVGMLLVRTFIKWRVFGWDDGLIVVATVVAVIQNSLLFSALRNGLGKIPENVRDIALIGNLTYASRILFLAAHHAAKLSVLFLLRRLFAKERRKIALLCDVTIGLTALSGVMAMLLSTVKCSAPRILVHHCDDQIARWSIITALDITTEGFTLILPSFMVWQVQMKVETKLRVIAAFAFRLVVIALSAAHLSSWISYTNDEPTPLTIVSSLILQQTLLAASLISATIPNLKAFLQSLSASWGEAGFGGGYTTKAYGNGTFEMHNLNSFRPTASQSTKNNDYAAQNHTDYETQVTAARREAGERTSLGSGGSQDLIIRKETAWTVVRS